SEVDKETIKKWEIDFEQESIEFFVIDSNEVKETILDFILYKKIDILTMVSYKRTFFQGLFHPSLTKKFANNFNVPILAIPMEE
ncbi:MAG: universal stress protein, partial [Flavobacterium sp.]